MIEEYEISPKELYYNNKKAGYDYLLDDYYKVGHYNEGGYSLDEMNILVKLYDYLKSLNKGKITDTSWYADDGTKAYFSDYLKSENKGVGLVVKLKYYTDKYCLVFSFHNGTKIVTSILDKSKDITSGENTIFSNFNTNKKVSYEEFLNAVKKEIDFAENYDITKSPHENSLNIE